MKSILFVSLCVTGVLLQGCVAGEQDLTEMEAPSGSSAPSARERTQDAKIATLDIGGGQVVFIDEGLTEPGGGIAFWELGDVNLSSLLDGLNGTALEVFLALAPEGTTPPARLLEHHAEVARRVGGIPLIPRRFPAALALPDHVSFTNEGLTDSGSGSAKNCWGWAGTNLPYSSKVGYQWFDEGEFVDNFNNQYSQISGSFVTSDSASALGRFGLEQSILGTTAAGHERAMAACMSKAVNSDYAMTLQSVCNFNVGRADLVVERTTDATYSNWTTADSISLMSFGHGARFRSNYTNSGGGARKYRMVVQWKRLNSEDPAYDSDCHDQIFGAWRSRQIITGPGDVEGL